jgi:imidazole glycerol phosphate synthase glutamine amidotransferase subunit
MSTVVAVVDTGVANTASVLNGLRRIGASPVLATEADVIGEAAFVVLPGVGAFGAGMRRLEQVGADRAIANRFRDDRPLLAICLGMQLLCDRSEESQGVAGIGVAAASVRSLPAEVRVPHLGWNSVEASAGSPFESGDAYFANSLCVTQPPDGWGAAWTTYGVRFASALWRGATLACQFHPELSGDWGLSVLESWLRTPSSGRQGLAC